jgi:hypothetical protein
MTANSFLPGRRGSNLFVLLLYLISMEIASATGDFSVRRLRLRFERPYHVLSTGYKEIEEDHTELIEEERKEPIVVPANVLTRSPIDDMENTEAYEKCFNLLNQVSKDSEVTRDEYVRFLELLTGGDMDYDDFTELPSLFVLIFSSTTCTSGQDCVHNMPTISLASSKASLGLLQFFCNQVMSVTFTEVSITFGYTIRYDSAKVTNEDLTDCLETATENLLLDSFDCPIGQDQQRRLNSVDQIDSSRAGAGIDPLQDELERSTFRYLDENINSFPSEAPSSAPTVGGDDCDYTISATVDSITDKSKFFVDRPAHPVNVSFETILTSYPLLCHSMYRYPGQRGHSLRLDHIDCGSRCTTNRRAF